MKYASLPRLALVLGTGCLLSTTRAWTICESCVPVELLSSAAFGVDWSMDYLQVCSALQLRVLSWFIIRAVKDFSDLKTLVRSSAIKYHNGTAVSGVSIGADASYRLLMQEFRQNSSGQKPGPYDPWSALKRSAC